MTVGVNYTSINGSGTLASSSASITSPASGNVGAIWLVYCDVANGRMIDSATYNSIDLTYIGTATGNRSNEDGEAEIWFGSWPSFPQGTQTLAWTANSGASGATWGYVFITLSGSGPCVLVEPARHLVTSSTANPTISYSAIDRSAMAFAATFSGLAAPSNLTVLTNNTALGSGTDFGQQSAVACRQTTAGTGAHDIGWTASADDIAMIAIRVTDALLNQDTWRWRDDNGNETAASWLAAAGANPSSITVTSNTKKRLRFALSDVQAYNNVQPILECGWSRPLSGDPTQLSYTSGQSCDLTNGVGIVGGHWTGYNGERIYHTDNTNDRCWGQAMSTPWDLTTMSVSTASSAYFSYGSQEGIGTSCSVSEDGTKAYIMGTNLRVYQYTLSTAWQCGGASYARKSYLTSITGNAGKHSWALGGTKLFIQDNTVGLIRSATLSTAWDVSTASTDSGVTFDYSNYVEPISNNADAFVSEDGRFYIICDSVNNKMYFFEMTTPGDLTTMQHTPPVWYVSNSEVSAGPFGPSGNYVISKNNTTDVFYKSEFATGFKYTPVTTTSEKARAADSTYITHAGDTTQQISSGTFITPNSGISETGTAGTDNDMDFTAGSKCEVEYVIEFVEADLSQDEELRFRIRNADSRSDI